MRTSTYISMINLSAYSCQFLAPSRLSPAQVAHMQELEEMEGYSTGFAQLAFATKIEQVLPRNVLVVCMRACVVLISITGSVPGCEPEEIPRGRPQQTLCSDARQGAHFFYFPILSLLCFFLSFSQTYSTQLQPIVASMPHVMTYLQGYFVASGIPQPYIH